MYCCIRSCPAKYGKAAVSFHRFPQNNVTRRQQWIEAAARGDSINYDYAMICSRHFVGGRPARVSDCDSVSWVPTLLLDKGMSDVDAMLKRQFHDAGVVDGGSIHDDDGVEVNCAVRGCGMTKEDNPSLLFFSVPRDAGQRRKWLLQIGMQNMNKSNETNKQKNILAVCELHFDLAKDLLNYDDVITMGRSAMLKENVMPTRNIPTVFGYQKVRFTHEAPDNPTTYQQEAEKPDDDDDDDDESLLEEMVDRNGQGHEMPEYPSHMETSPLEEFVEICRSCLSTNKTNLVSAYDDRLAEIFFQFTNVNIDVNDGISTMICVDCKSRLLDIHFFRDTCVTNTQILIHRYQKCYGITPGGANTHTDQRENDIMQYDDELEGTSQNVESTTKYNSYDMGADDPEDLLMPQKEEVEQVTWKVKPGRPRKPKPEPISLRVPPKIVPQIATMKKRFKCKFCRKEYNSRPGFDMHMATHKYHSQSEFVVRCERCDVRSRKNEVHRCYTDILYCYVCGEQYRKWSYLKIHLAKVHKIKTKRRELMIKLKEMGYVSGSRANALKIPPINRRPPQDSDNEFEITEPVEDPESEKSDSAQSDRSTPTDMRPKCSFCGVSFRQNSCLDMHMKTHSAIELTQCNECDLSFDTYRHLERHHEDHEDETPQEAGVKCRHCGKKLKRNQTVLLHYQYVHKDKDVVQCSNCPQLVENATQLAKHICSKQQKKIVSSSVTPAATTTATAATNGDFVIIQPESILKGTPPSSTMDDDSTSVPVGLQGGDGADPLLGLGNDEVIELDSDDDDDESSLERSSFDCSICDKTFEKKDIMERHMKLHRMMSAAKANEIGLRNCFFRGMNSRREVSHPSAI